MTANNTDKLNHLYKAKQYLASNKVTFFLLLILLAASGLRFFNLDLNGIWVDESNTVIISQNNIPGIVNALSYDASPPFYYSILHYWMLVFGDSVSSVRALSALFGILLTAALFYSGNRLFNRETGIYAALFCAVSPIQIFYSQQARMYSLLPLAGLLSMTFFILLLNRFSKKNLSLYLIFTICTVFTHHYGFLLIPVQAVLIFFAGNKKTKIILACVVLFGALIKYKIWWYKVVGLFGPATPSYEGWMGYFWKQYGFYGFQLKSFQSFAPGGPLPPYVGTNSMPWQPLFPVIYCFILLIVSLTPILFYKRFTQNERKSIFTTLIFGFLPLFCAATYSLIFEPAYLAGRSDQIVFPAFALIFGSGIYYLHNRYAKTIAIILLLFFSTLTLNTYYKTDTFPGDREIARAVDNILQKGDSIICTSLTRASLQYYLRDKLNIIHFYSFPKGNEKNLAWHNPGNYKNKRDLLSRDINSIEKSIMEEKEANGRIFIIYEDISINRYLLGHFQRQSDKYNIRSSKWIPQSGTGLPARIILFENKAD